MMRKPQKLMIDISTTYMGLKLKSPIIAGSSGLTNSLDNLIEIARQGAGAVVLKSVFEEQIKHEISRALAADTSNSVYPEAYDYISHYTQEQSLEHYLNLISEAKKKIDIPVIASVNCISSTEWISFSKRLQDAGADAIELNVFVLPSNQENTGQENENVYFNIVQEVKKFVSIPISLKISYYFSSLAKTAMQLSWTGISGLVLFNRFFSPDIDIDKMEISPGFVFSKAEDIGISLRWIAMLSDKVHCDLSASTGNHSSEAVIKQLLAGAKSVQLASVLYKEGFGIISKMNEEIRNWMESKGFEKTEDFIGKLSLKNADNPAAYERVQFMKHFAGIE